MQSIKNAVVGLGNTIINGIVDSLKMLFIPSDDFFAEKLSPFNGAFGFVGQFVQLAKSIIDMCSNPNVAAPSFTIDLSSSNFSWDLGDSVTISFAWYEPYRNTVNAWLSGFMWLGFIWNTFKDLPGIINGASSAINSGMKIGGE